MSDPSFDFTGGVQIENVNLRKEGDEDHRVISVDIKIAGQIEMPALCHLLGVAASEIHQLWHSNDEAEPKLTKVKKVDLDNKYLGMIAVIGEMQFTNVELKGMSFKFKSHHRVELTMTITISDTTQNVVSELAQMLDEHYHCAISAMQLDMLSE